MANILTSEYSTSTPIYPTKNGYAPITTPPSRPPSLLPGTIFYQLRCGGGGNLIVLGKEGNYLYYPNVAAGETILTWGLAIVASATIDGQSVSTTASDIWWYGGK